MLKRPMHYSTELRPADEAVLVGSLAGASRRRLAMPDRAGFEAGEILIFSLGHDEVVARFDVPALDPKSGEAR